MSRLLLRRLAGGIPLILGVLTLTFVLMEAAPGSFVDLLIDQRPMPPEVRERLERAYGQDRSVIERYLALLGDLSTGRLRSLSRARPVWGLIADALPPTLLLMGAGLAIHVLAGVLAGLVAASRRRRWPDRLINVGGLMLYAMPAFWLGLMAILLLAARLPLFPAGGARSVDAESWSWLARAADLAWHVTLPALVLGLASAGAMARFVRSGLLEALTEEFVRAARARGVGPRRVLVGHALRNALLPVINLLGLSLPVLVSGSLVIEVVFARPGMGRLTWEAIRAQDVPLVLGSTLLATLLVVLGNLLADLLMSWADPRVRLRRAGQA